MTANNSTCSQSKSLTALVSELDDKDCDRLLSEEDCNDLDADTPLSDSDRDGVTKDYDCNNESASRHG